MYTLNKLAGFGFRNTLIVNFDIFFSLKYFFPSEYHIPSFISLVTTC